MNRARHLGVIINPVSGRRGGHPGEAARRRHLVATAAAMVGVTVDIRVTEASGHARSLAADCVAAGCDVIVAMGGDGTVNEVAQALVGGDVPLAIVPSGSGDGLARGLGIPTGPRAFDVAISGGTLTMDVGYANQRLFLNVAGVGFDAEVGKHFGSRELTGGIGYVWKAMSLVGGYRAGTYEVDLDEHRRLGSFFLIAFANSREYGNGAVLAPGASVSDGLLDVVMIDGASALGHVWSSRRLFWRQRASARGVARAKTSRAVVTGAAITCHVDGDVIDVGTRLEVTLRPGALRVKVPAAQT